MYTTAAMDGVMSEILVCIKFANLSPKTISNLQLNLPDSSTMKVVRMVSCSYIALFLSAVFHFIVLWITFLLLIFSV